MSIELLKVLKDELQADIYRPEGRYGIHGRSCVDDDYFLALEYVVKRITELEALSRTSQPVQAVVPDYKAMSGELLETLIAIKTQLIMDFNDVRRLSDSHLLAEINEAIAKYEDGK